MGDETPNRMNLDLNVRPLVSPSTDNELLSGSLPNESVNLEEWIDESVHRRREAVRRRQRYRSLWRPRPIPHEHRDIALELILNSSDSGGGGGGGGSGSAGRLQTGEGSFAAEERNTEIIKTCENNTTHAEDEALGKNEEVEKGSSNEGSFFDCNICLDLARDPVVTTCGHMFCWPCLYQWLHVHSDANECPVCKGEVTIKNVIPIYGRGKNNNDVEEDSSLKIPQRPHARRVESWRQTIQRTAFTVPMEEMIRRLGNRVDLAGDLLQVQPQDTTDSTQNSPERNNHLLNRFLNSRGMRRERNTVPPDDVVDLTHPTNSGVGESRWLSSLLLRRSHSHRAARIFESYFRHHPVEANHGHGPPIDDTDSVSSIAAVIHSESQTIDTAVEIDSTVSLSTSSSRRRNDTSRVSDVDSGDSRAPRRRRLN
ncbi:hypothetical protein F0562_017203 [Nyssa sinensis]|uniref:E3 ubiquitin-protein ligase RMA n=1 Tax=Nyssa sinensis TaxID=561372 RepID=A0A5J4ZG49_9ASTE|nr:hypothetical protein F0562_017203 [Nyssa sinensis]